MGTMIGTWKTVRFNPAKSLEPIKPKWSRTALAVVINYNLSTTYLELSHKCFKASGASNVQHPRGFPLQAASLFFLFQDERK